MEIELKYKVDSAELCERILSDAWLRKHAESAEPEIVRMQTTYFDTADRSLAEHDIAFRVRAEGERMLATLKWRDNDEGISGLYVRSEINIPVTDKSYLDNPDPAIFGESAEGKDLLDIIDGKALMGMFDVVFTRKRIRVDYERSILEIAVDEGSITAESKTAPFMELEIEIYSGNREDLLAVGKKIAEKYHLEPERKTKFARGIELLNISHTE